MLDSDKLRSVLKEIFDINDKYLVPINQGWLLPTIDKDDKVGTWIGYRIMAKDTRVRSNIPDAHVELPVVVRFRLTFVGPQAEALAEQTILWDSRDDVRQAFAKENAQLFYEPRRISSYALRNSGFNDYLIWYVDMSVVTTYGEFITRSKW